MNTEHQHSIFVEIESACIELVFGVKIVFEALPFEPAEQSPFGRRQMARLPTFNGIGDLFLR